MVAKIIVHGADRTQALARMKHALEHLVIEGIDTNREFLLDLISTEDFVNQDHHTRWVEQSFLSGWQERLESKEQL